MAHSYTCLVPFYNEDRRILNVLKIIEKVKKITQIICIDDGSTDETVRSLRRKYPHIFLVRLPRNSGKAAAVSAGLTYAEHENILLVDADLIGLKEKDLERATDIFSKQNCDMILLRRVRSPLFVRLCRGDVLLTGERILKKTDLLRIMETRPNGYELEVAINAYMMKHNKRTVWVPSHAINTYKIHKWDPGLAFSKYLDILGMFTFNGLVWYFFHFITFARKEAQAT